MKLLLFIGFAVLAFIIAQVSYDLIDGSEGRELSEAIGAVVVVEALLVVVPYVLLWQWYDLAYSGRSDLSGSERYYYGLTVFLIGALLVAAWYLVPCRIFITDLSQEAIPEFQTNDEAREFLDEARSWVTEAEHVHWLIVPLILIVLPYARIVAKTPPFVHARGSSAQAAIEKAQRGLTYALYRLSVAMQRRVDDLIKRIQGAIQAVNRAISSMVERGINIVLNLTDLAFRLTALLALLSIGLVLLIPGLLTGSVVLIVIGVVVTGSLVAIGLVSFLAPDRKNDAD